MASHPQKAAAFAAIKEHLATVGSSNWKVILEAFPDVAEPTMWRWIRDARAADIPKPVLVNSRAKVLQKIKGVPNDRAREARANGTEPIARHIPAAPSPNYISQSGEAGMQNVDVVMELRALYRDAEMLRSFGVANRVDADGVVTEVIKNPNAFDKSIVRRATLLETMIATVQQVWDLRTMQSFYQAIIEEIGAESPATQKRIMERLAVLNSAKGMTMGMQL